MSQTVDEFFINCENVIYGGAPQDPPPNLDQLYQQGVTHLTTETSFPIKERILYYLITLFPVEHPQLYYYMGWINLGTGCPTISMYWFMKAMDHFMEYRKRTNQVHPCEVENWLDIFKILFDESYTKKFQDLLDKYRDVIQDYIHAKDVRLMHVLGAYYIKVNQLKHAQDIYSVLLSPECTKDIEMEYQIQNNALILYSRMARFESLHDLLKRNLTICQRMTNVAGVDQKTKRNLFCSNMLQFDYIYHDPEERRQLCESLVHTYYPVTAYTGPTPLPPAISNRKLTIGYVSADILHHAVSNFILPILANHDISKFRVILFMNRYYKKIMTEPQYAGLRARCEMVDIEGRDTADCVREIRARDVDVLFDLHGYTEKNRLDIFAQNPAPIQISYLGFPNTVGSRGLLGWRITDAVADPVGGRQWWAEERVRLPGGFLLYKSIALNGPIRRRRPEGADDGHQWVVFGALNRESKNTPEVLECWREILSRTKNTRLLIKLSTTEDDEIHIENYRRVFVGIDPDRLIFPKYGTTEDYFYLYSAVDILLDCFPYSGTTTTCNALYNSVPVITMKHPDLHAHNVSSSLLHHIGLPELIASNPEEYIELAVALSQDSARLRQYRDEMLVHRKFEAHMRPERFMPEFEGAILDIVGRSAR